MSAILLALVLGVSPEVQKSANVEANNSGVKTSTVKNSTVVSVSKPLHPAALKRKVRAAMKLESQTRGQQIQSEQHEKALVKLLGVYLEVKQHEKMSKVEKKSWLRFIQARLDIVKLQARRAERKANRAAPKNLKKAKHVLAQVPGGGQQQRDNRRNFLKTANEGNSLVELIENTICPGSWETNGGEGRIVYFKNQKVLVIHNTAEVHARAGNIVGALRK